MVRVGGVVVEAGTFVDMGPVAINPNSDICTKNVTVIGVGGETATSYLPSMRLMAANLDRLPFDRIVTHRMPLKQAREAVELAQTDAAMKVVMAPQRRCGSEDLARADRHHERQGLMETEDPVGKPPTILDVARRAGVSKSTVRT